MRFVAAALLAKATLAPEDDATNSELSPSVVSTSVRLRFPTLGYGLINCEFVVRL
jgi:hypothetical protein